MSDPEKYARPGLYLDEDNHERLLNENREAYIRERIERLNREIEEMKVAMKHVSPEEKARLQSKIESHREEILELKVEEKGR